MAKIVLPRVQAMMVCDAIKESEEEGDVFHLHGVRTVVEAPAFPALRPRLGVLAHLSGHAGWAAIRMAVNRIETDEMIHESVPKYVDFRKPTTVVTVVFRARNCVFPAPGIYYVQIYHDEKLIGERPLELREER